MPLQTPSQFHTPALRPKVSKSGDVVSNSDIEHDNLLTFDFLCRQSRGFLKPYWEVVNKVKIWLFQQVGSRENLSRLFSEARQKGRESEQYTVASNQVRSLVNEWTNTHDREIGMGLNRRIIMQLVTNEVLGLSIIDPLWRDNRVKEVYVNGPFDIQVESDYGLMRVSGASFMNQAHALEFCTKLLSDYNKSLDSTNCVAESRLNDGSRFEAVHPAVAPAGPNIDIRRHDEHFWTISDLVKTRMISKEMLIDLERYIRMGLSIIVSGGTSTGKTTTINALSGLFPNNKRIVTIEDTLELHLNRNKLVAAPMEAREAGLNGSGAITLAKLVKTSLRLSPSFIIIGETRGSEAYNLCDASNTGHTCMTSIHSNSATGVVSRLEMAISQGGEITGTATFGAIQSAFPIILEIKKFMTLGGKTRRIITGIHEISPHITANQAGEPELKTIPLWEFQQTGLDENGEVLGNWVKVRELSDERIQGISDYYFVKPRTWHGLLRLENIPAKERMIATDMEDVADFADEPTSMEFGDAIQPPVSANGANTTANMVNTPNTPMIQATTNNMMANATTATYSAPKPAFIANSKLNTENSNGVANGGAGGKPVFTPKNPAFTAFQTKTGGK